MNDCMDNLVVFYGTKKLCKLYMIGNEVGIDAVIDGIKAVHAAINGYHHDLITEDEAMRMIAEA